MDTPDQVESLTKLGLTINQSKIYLALVKSKPSAVTQIAKSANLAREVVYRTAPKLQRMGLITKTISFPSEFEAFPIDIAVKILLERRNKEAYETKVRADELVAQIKNKSKEENKKEPQLISIFGKEHLAIFSRKKVLATRISLDTMIRKSVFPGWWEDFHPILKKLLAKNVKVRVIVAYSAVRVNVKDLKNFEKNKNFKVKFISEKIKAGIGIIDSKDTLINTLPSNVFTKASFYWSNDPGVVDLSSTYFEKYWNLKEI